MRTSSLFSIVSLLVLAAVASGQQGGGGFGGVGIEQKVQIDDFSAVYRSSELLTPSEDAEYPVKVEKGDALIIQVTSGEFDTAVKVVDEEGELLGENDDAGDGTQNSRLVVEFPEAGTYKVVVQGFKSKAGGRYSIEMRKFRTLAAAVGETVQLPGEKPWRFVAVDMRRGDVKRLHLEGQGVNPAMVIDPEGTYMGLTPERHMLRFNNEILIQALEDGVHYVGLTWDVTRPGTVAVHDVAMDEQAFDGNGRYEIKPGLNWLRLSGKRGDLVHVAVPDPSQGVVMTDVSWLRPLGEKEEIDGISFEEKKEESVVEVTRPLTLAQKGTAGQTALQFMKDGAVTLLFWQREEGQAVQISSLDKAAAMGQTSQARLEIGGVDYYSMTLEEGQWFEAEAASDQFDIQFELFRSDGTSVANRDDGPGSLNPSVRLWIEASGEYFLKVNSTGGGGGGAYSIRVEKEPVPHFPGSDVLEAEAPEGGQGVWTMDLKEGEVFWLRNKTAVNFTLRPVAGTPEDAYEARTVHLGSERFLMVRVMKSCQARLWVYSGSAFKIVKEPIED